MIGWTLSHFEITAELGEGGIGEVYRAEDGKLGRQVAIKILPNEVSADPERLAPVHHESGEAQAIGALNHPNIVTIHSVEKADGLHLLTIELVEDESLDQVLPTGFDPDSCALPRER